MPQNKNPKAPRFNKYIFNGSYFNTVAMAPKSVMTVEIHLVIFAFMYITIHELLLNVKWYVGR